MSRKLRAVLAAAAVTAATATLVSPAPAAHAATAKPDLRVKSAKVDRATITEGATLKIAHVVQNQGKAPAKASVTRFYLTTDVAASLAARKSSRTNPRSSLTDVLLSGEASVGAIKPGRTASVQQVEVTVPVGTPPADYKVLACTDDLGAVKESDEADNCTPATGELEVEAAEGSDGLQVQSFSDTARWPDDEDDNLSYIKIFCSNVYPTKSYTLSAALTSVRNHLEELAPGGLEKVRSSDLASTPIAAQQLAATALTQGSPGLALAALLRAYELQPSRGTHLVNAAALATSIGLPNEALAFLDASVGREFLRTPLGIPHEATAAVTRGNALLLLGKYDAAQKLFAGAKQMAPILSEADAGLATVAACKGQDALAARYLRRSRIRSDDPVPTTPPTEEPTQPEPEVDITRGLPSPLRQLPLPETPAQGVKLNDVYKGIQQGFQGEIQAHNDEENQIQQHLRATDDARTEAEIERRDGLLVMLYRSGQEGEIAAAQDAVFQVDDQLTELREGFWGGGTGEAPYTYGDLQEAAFAACAGSSDDNCFLKEMNRTCRPALTSAHDAYRTKLALLQTRANHYFELLSKRMSGVAANLIDEEAHRLALLTIEESESSTYALIVQAAQAWTHYENLFRAECVDPLPAEVLNPPTADGAADPGACPTGLKAASFKVALGPSSLKINCERIEQSISAEVVPLLHLFLDVKFDFRTGNVSAWAGVKGGGKVGSVVDAGFKSGLYVKVNQQGDLVDTGWRVGPNVKVIAGSNAEFTAYKDEIDLSFTESTTPGY
ncbi:MAG TPA: CARDB domain-containing protein [Nocardioides sp.]|nr:CARDB domain-containing protein [Nocardioides sp.]